jgi:DNA invertase Pin-like site-specific DNA recombinase
MKFDDAVGLEAPDDRLLDRVTEAIQRGVVGFFRQSTMIQMRRNLGSQRVQEEQVRHLRPFGVTPEDVKVILAYGESGREGVVRAKFRELVELVEAGRVGLVVLARHDRLGRNTHDSQELYDLMREMGVLIMVDGRIYDPSDINDDFVLGIYAKFAEYENRARARYIALSMFANARRLAARIPLPTGLVWASPDDPDFRRAAAEAGLLHALDQLDLHRACSRVEERAYYILPHPDRDLQQAVRCAAEWLLETGSLRHVLQRIETGYPGWPKPGEVPIRAGGSRYTRETGVQWVKVTPTRIYEWLRSPALYGTYQFRARSLAPKVRRRQRKPRRR